METVGLKMSFKQKGDCPVSVWGVDVQQRRGQGWLLRLGYVVLKKMMKVCCLVLLPPGVHWDLHGRDVSEAHSHGSLLLFPRRLEHF